MRTVVPRGAKLIPPEATQVFKGKIFDVYQWEQKMFDGSTETFELLRRPDTLQILAIRDGKVVVLHEEQPHHGEFIGLPGGRHDHPDEDELQAAKREMLEETGMRFKTWRLIKAWQPEGKIEWFIYLYVASDFIDEVPPKLDAGEKITIQMLDYDELMSLADTRNLPKDVLEKAGSIEGLLALPEYRAS